MRRACLYAICDQFLKKVELEARNSKNDILICRVLDYIQTHYTENITTVTALPQGQMLKKCKLLNCDLQKCGRCGIIQCNCVAKSF